MASSNKLLVKNLYCVEYPGNVQNVDRMIDTLGGINNISNVSIKVINISCHGGSYLRFQC